MEKEKEKNQKKEKKKKKKRKKNEIRQRQRQRVLTSLFNIFCLCGVFTRYLWMSGNRLLVADRDQNQ